jgi:uncharacterized membrane protein YcaP (DUF421 family)
MEVNCMNSVIFNTVLRGTAVYILALILARLIGRKLISQMTFFDFIVGVSMGSLIANAIVGTWNVSLSAALALILLSLLTIATGYINIKNFKTAKLINSEPVTLVQNGNIVEENMKKTRMTINELMMKLREKNTFNLADVEFAIMESDGQLSILPKAYKQPLTPSHMNIQTTSSGLTRDIIIDGSLMEENLASAGLDRAWLNNELKNMDIRDISEVFYAGVDNTKKLFVSRRNNNISETHGKYGTE